LYEAVLYVFRTDKAYRINPEVVIVVTVLQVHNYNTRSRIAENYRPQACRTNPKQFTILFQGPKIWNARPSHIKDLSSLSTFKKHFAKIIFIRRAHNTLFE
jgi:hypothetical protein